MVIEWDELKEADVLPYLTEVKDNKFSNPAEIIRLVKELNIEEPYAVCGGAMMVVRGIKPSTYDIDILVINETWQKFRNIPEWVNTLGRSGNCLTNNGIELLCILGFTNIPRIQNYIEDAILIDGLRFVRPSDTIQWKQIVGRNKDYDDIKLLEKYFNDKIDIKFEM